MSLGLGRGLPRSPKKKRKKQEREEKRKTGHHRVFLNTNEVASVRHESELQSVMTS